MDSFLSLGLAPTLDDIRLLKTICENLVSKILLWQVSQRVLLFISII